MTATATRTVIRTTSFTEDCGCTGTLTVLDLGAGWEGSKVTFLTDCGGHPVLAIEPVKPAVRASEAWITELLGFDPALAA